MVNDQEESKSSNDSLTQDELEIKQEDQDVQSSSTESETEDDLLSVVQSAIKDDDKPSEETESQSVEEKTEEVKTEETVETEAVESKTETESKEDDELDKVPLHLQPRFKEVIAEKNSFKKGHEQYVKITDSLKKMNLSAQETAQGLTIMGLMKNDPQEALKALEPIISNLKEVTGAKIPEDIQQKIDDGYMDEDAGAELAKTRADVQMQKNANQSLVDQQKKADEQQSVNQIAQTVNQWEERTRKTDPDFDLKQDEIDDRVSALVRERGRPNTPKEAESLAQEAYDTVTKRHHSRLGVKRPIRSMSNNKLGGSPMPEPKSLMEAVQNAMAGGS